MVVRPMKVLINMNRAVYIHKHLIGLSADSGRSCCFKIRLNHIFSPGRGAKKLGEGREVVNE